MATEQFNIETNPLQGISTDVSTSTPDINSLYLQDTVQQIQTKAEQLNFSQDYTDFLARGQAASSFDTFRDNRLKFEEFTIDPSQTHTRLHSGELVPMFESFMPNTDNQERLARQQSTAEKWGHGIAKFGTTVGTTILGGTIGSINGIVQGISEGSFQSVFDNEFTRTMDDWNTKMRYQLPNYYTKQEQEKGFFGQIGTANFYADKLFGAAAFTIGAVVSEGLWVAATGGASLATTAARIVNQGFRTARWSKRALGGTKVAKSLENYKGSMKQLTSPFKRKVDDLLAKDAVIRSSKFAEGLNTARFLYTSSGYEAGVEALHYKKEAEEEFWHNFRELNGRDPNGQELRDFQENLENSANAVFAGNMAILAPSNAVMFGSLFRIGKPFKGIGQSLNKSLFGVGTKKTVDAAGKATFTAIKAKKAQKIFGDVYAITKPIATEGLWEEGGQGALSAAASAWIESGYDPENSKETIGMMDAMYQGMGEMYGSKEGWVEIGIGAIIGGGSSLVQGRGRFKEIGQLKAARERQEKIAKGQTLFGGSLAGEDILSKRMVMSNKIRGAVKTQQQAESQGRFVEAELANDDQLIGNLEFRHSIGENILNTVDTARTALNNVTAEQWAKEGITDPEAYKQEILSSYESLVRRYQKNMRYSQAVLGVSDEDLIGGEIDSAGTRAQALAHALTKGENAGYLQDNAVKEITRIMGEDYKKSLNIISELSRLKDNDKRTLNRRLDKLKTLKQQARAIEGQMLQLQAAPKETAPEKSQAEEHAKLAARALEINNEINELQEQIELTAKELGQERARRDAVDESPISEVILPENIMVEELETLQERMDNLDAAINAYEGSNPQLYQELKSLGTIFKDATEWQLRYQDIANGFISGKINIFTKRSGGLLGKLLNRKPDNVDSFTIEFLVDTIGSYQNALTERGAREELDDVSAEEFAEAPTQEILQNIAQKIRNKDTLGPNEQSIYGTRKEEIDAEIERQKEDVGDNPLSENKPPKPSAKTQVEALEERLSEAMSNPIYPIGFFATTTEELLKNKPSQEDIDRYRELLDKDRMAEEEIEFEQLQEKLGEWKLMDSLAAGNMSIAQILELINQLKQKQEESEVKTEVTTPEIIEIADESQKSENRFVPELLQNTTSNSTVKNSKGKINFTHLGIQFFLDKLGGSLKIVYNNKVYEDSTANRNKYGDTPGALFVVTRPNGQEVTLEVAAGRGVMIKEKDYTKNLNEDLGLFVLVEDGTSWSYKDVYEKQGDTYRPKASEFEGDPINNEAVYEAQEGDLVEFLFDVDDQWNIEQKRRLDEDKIDQKEYKDSLKIFVVKDGEIVGTLKRQSRDQNSFSESLDAIRERAEHLDSTGVFGSSTVTQVILGSPKFQLNDDLQPQEHNFNDRSAGQVLATGYVQDGKLTLSDKTLEDDTNQFYVEKISKENEGKKVPAVVFKRGSHNVAFPVSLIGNSVPMDGRFQEILNDTTLDETNKVLQINQLLASIGVAPSKYDLVDLQDNQKLVDIERELQNNSVTVAMDTFSSAEYNAQSLQGDATIKIDLEDVTQVFTSPKLRIDLDDYTIYTELSEKYESMTSLEKGISDYTIEVESAILNEYKDENGDAIEDTFTDVMTSDNVINRNPASNAIEQRNKNILFEAMTIGMKGKRNSTTIAQTTFTNKSGVKTTVNYRLPNQIADSLGGQTINQLAASIKRYDFVKNNLNQNSNKKVQQKKNKVKCKS